MFAGYFPIASNWAEFSTENYQPLQLTPVIFCTLDVPGSDDGEFCL
jgi:hypothetical protein